MFYKVSFNYTSKYQPMLALSDIVNGEKLELMKSKRNIRIIGIQEIDNIKKMKPEGRVYTDRENGVYYE